LLLNIFFKVGSLNRYNIKHTSHYNPWLTHGINHLKSELGLTVQGSYHDPDGNDIHFDPKGETFGICPISDVARVYFNMLPFNESDPAKNEDEPSNTPTDTEDVSDNGIASGVDSSYSLVTQVLQLSALPLIKASKLNISQYQYLASCQNVKYAIVPVHTDEERILFWNIYNDLKMHEKTNPDFMEMAQEWCKRCNHTNGKLKENQQPVVFYKIPEILESFFNKYQSNNTYKDCAKIPQNAEMIKKVKNAVNSSKRPAASFPPAILPSPLRGSPSFAPLTSNKRKSDDPLQPDQSQVIAGPVVLTTDINPVKKPRTRRCTRCKAIDPENMYKCPGKQHIKNCKHYSP